MWIHGLDEEALPDRLPFLLSPRFEYDVTPNACFLQAHVMAAPWNTNANRGRAIRTFLDHVNQFYAWAQRQGHVAELPIPQRPRRLVPGLMRRSSAVLDTINHCHHRASCRGRSIGAALMSRARETARDEMNLEQLLRLAARGGVGHEDF